MTLTKKDRKQLLHLLDQLQVHLESHRPRPASRIKRDRRDWRAAEDFKIRLEKEPHETR